MRIGSFLLVQNTILGEETLLLPNSSGRSDSGGGQTELDHSLALSLHTREEWVCRTAGGEADGLLSLPLKQFFLALYDPTDHVLYLPSSACKAGTEEV